MDCLASCPPPPSQTAWPLSPEPPANLLRSQTISCPHPPRWSVTLSGCVLGSRRCRRSRSGCSAPSPPSGARRAQTTAAASPGTTAWRLCCPRPFACSPSARCSARSLMRPSRRGHGRATAPTGVTATAECLALAAARVIRCPADLRRRPPPTPKGRDVLCLMPRCGHSG